jgi:hypothetical protein
MMRKLMLTLAVAIAITGMMAANASAETIDLAFTGSIYLGHIDPGSPSSESDEVGYIAYLITLASNAEPVSNGVNTYDRLGSTASGSFPAPTGGDRTNTPTTEQLLIDVTGYNYLLGKYGNESYVWFVSGIGPNDDVRLPKNDGADGVGEISHFTLFGERTTVPDGGLTVMLLGIGMGGLAILSRKFRA